MRALLVALLVAAITCHVGLRAEPVITLRELEQEALSNNPEMRMAEKKAEAAQERKKTASAMPDPMIGYEIQNVGAPGTSTPGKEEMSMKGVVVTQQNPFPG